MNERSPARRRTRCAVTARAGQPLFLRPARWMAMAAALVWLAASPPLHAAAERTKKLKATHHAPAGAQQTAAEAAMPTRVHRCVQPDGRTLYSQQPCPSEEARATVMSVSDHRTRQQVLEGQAAQSSSVALAKVMQKDRLKFEKGSGARPALALTSTGPKPEDLKHPGKQTQEKKPKGRKTEAAGRDDRRQTRQDPRAPKALSPADFTARVPSTSARSPSRQPSAGAARASAG